MKKLIIIFLIFIAFKINAQVPEHLNKIKGTFKSPQEVTALCLSCHEEAAKQIMATTHWTWLSTEPILIPGHEKKVRIGKRNVFNNFCINLNSNWQRCTSCHVGFGWKDKKFDFSEPKNVDCLICHDHTGTYKKSPAGAGYPDKKVDLLFVARNVGLPTPANCGSCHFFGGGGENVKHGDLEPALINPDSDIDVHLGANGMVCQDCHETKEHHIKGIALSVTNEAKTDQVECISCHEAPVHEIEVLNRHSKRIACQTCHIPFFAKGKPTKVYWDWSDAGKAKIASKDKFGKPTFNKKKGSFKWDMHIKPVYRWYNGTSERYLLGDKINEHGITELNYPLGSKDDAASKIYPFKVHRGKQIADAKYKYLIVPKLWGGFWKHFDWNLASEDGMKSVGLPYSGKYEFAATEMYLQIDHEVVAGEHALKCLDCHGENGRLGWKALGYVENPAPKEEIEKMLK